MSVPSSVSTPRATQVLKDLDVWKNDSNNGKQSILQEVTERVEACLKDENISFLELSDVEIKKHPPGIDYLCERTSGFSVFTKRDSLDSNGCSKFGAQVVIVNKVSTAANTAASSPQTSHLNFRKLN